MSKVFVKGNNFMRQLGLPNKAKELAWVPLDLSGSLVSGSRAKIVKAEANQSQTCVMTADGRRA